MMGKIRANLSYFLCAALGTLHLILLALPYLKWFRSWEGTFSRIRTTEGISGYRMMGMGYAEKMGCDAEALGVIGGILQILILLFVLGMLALGVFGILKAFGVFEQLPDEVAGHKTTTIGALSLLGYTALMLTLFLVLLIFSLVNMESFGSVRTGISLGGGLVWSLLLGGAATAGMIFLPKLMSGNAVENAPSYHYVCAGCGKKAKKTDKFCSVCGGTIEAVEVKHYERVCSGCGKKAKKTDKFCNVCGGAIVEREIVAAAPVAPAAPVAQEIPASQKPMAPAANVCPACGKAVAEGNKFCNFCGTQL